MPSFGPLLENWTPEQTERMEKAIFVAHHRLHELEMFSDDALAALVDKQPAHALGINTMGHDPTVNEWQEGLRGDLSADDLLESVRSGRIWLNFRRVMDYHREYHDLVHAIYDELEGVCPGLFTFNRSANLLVSAPGAQVYAHVDSPLNMLWHVRGVKRVWAYPLETGIVSAETIEKTLAGDKSEEIEFQPEWDDLAVVYDLQPGEMVTWPQHTPHRVQNTEGMNVSLSTEHFTKRALRKVNVFLANKHFRTLLPGDFQSTELDGFAPAFKEFALRVARRVPGLRPEPTKGFEYPVTFQVDLDAPDCVRPLKAQQPEPATAS